MSAHRPNAPCPCGTGRKYKRCCRPFHRGAPAPDPERLMRSRYSAYALGELDYLVDTTCPGGPQWRTERESWLSELADYVRATRFEGLKVLSTEVAGNEGSVSFHAQLSRGSEDLSFGESSRFVRMGARWLYHSGRPL
ncbi:MAG: YchJ family metal-binding protein [Myxococcota bacterium]|nr:YchJ family metal-binding protein [Myxococcota bacterium]